MSRTASPDWFVVYKGEDAIATGTIGQCARALGVRIWDVQSMATPSKIAAADSNPESQRFIAVRVRAEELA